MPRKTKRPTARPGAVTSEHSANYTPPREYPAGLHRVLNLVVDSAIVADDANKENDGEGLARAISALMLNARIVKRLALSRRTAP